MQINVKNSRYANLLRLSDAINHMYNITVYANSDYLKHSSYFDLVNPFDNDFVKNLPLILEPVNAGHFNTYITGVGDTSSLGIVERNGKVRNSVPIYMRASDKERFTINFRTETLQEHYSPRDYILYLHFIVETF